MLSLKNISLRRGRKLLFENATFQVHAGQRLGLVGANGCGKTSLFSMLQGELDADSGELELSPQLLIAHVAQQSPAGRHTALDFVQDGDGELRRVQKAIKLAEEQGDSAKTHHLFDRLETIDGFSAESRAARLLHGLGFATEDYGKPVETFSGGWRMRLNLAQALMCRSDILLLDEPTNHLDLPAILWLEQWLKRYQGILLVISHDRDFLDGVCTRIAHMEHGEIRVYNGNYSDFELLRASRLAQQQAMFKRQQKEVKHLQSYVDRFRYKASKARQAQSRLKMLERMTLIAPAHVDSPFHFRFMEPGRQPHHLAQLEAVTAGYDGPVLSHVNLLISAGDRLGLLGVNGAGKSTLVKALADGSTLLGGERTLSQHTRIGYFAQHQLDLLDPERSPADHLRSIEPDIAEPEMRRYLGGFGFGGERIFDPVEPFSGGEKARLVLALMIRRKPNLLLLDEPTNHLDLEMRQALSRALVDFGGAIVVISHDRHLLRSVCDDLLVVHGGAVDRFDRAVDDYSSWLKEQEEELPGETRPAAAGTGSQVARKEKRRNEAERRRQLKPLSDQVRSIERQMEDLRKKLARMEQVLADNDIYTDASRKEELTGLLREQAGLKSEVESLEWSWLDASEALERARQELED
ncbi:MAG: ATP-binding cassette domain-containing protein [Xanthomonadales bacterium]|nr:ATP-binding cassette domain-containing protein [Xanthomonadales bacterium]